MCTAVASSQENLSNLTKANMKTVGLVDAHAYSLIGAREITQRTGRKVKLCYVRNPWGKREWTGDWSDNSSLWTEYVKK